MVKGISLIIAALAFLAFASPLFAQQDPDDPGAADSIIIGTVYVDSGTTEIQVPVYLFADESVMYINVPVSWQGRGGIDPVDVIDLDPDDCFTIYNTVMADHIRIFSFADMPDTICYLPFPNGERLNLFSILFSIAPDAPDQQVFMDTTWDDRAHSAIFGLLDGITEITPAVVPGSIIYGAGAQRVDDNNNIPAIFTLAQNYPNPFNPSTNIAFSLNKAEQASLVIYDLLGRRIRTLHNGRLETGDYMITWDGKSDDGNDVPSGAYFYRLMAGDNTETKRMTLLR
jgi:hypothetical protein